MARLPAALCVLCVNRGGLKAFGLLYLAVWPIGEENMALAVPDGRGTPKGVGVDGESKEFSTDLNAGRRGDAGRFDTIVKAFSELSTLGAEKRLELVSNDSESVSSQIFLIFSLALASAVLDGAIHPFFEALMKPLVKGASSVKPDEAD